MRFTLAAAALLTPSCSSLPSSLNPKDIMEIKSKLLMENVQQHTSHFPLLKRTLMMDKRRKQLDQPPARRTKEECDPDVGILDCSVGMFCQPDEGSLLGGVCTWGSDQRRKLAVNPDALDFFGNLACGAYAQYYPFCNCDDWDNNTHTGTGTCYTEWVLCHHCGDDSFCASSNKSIFQTDGYNSTSTFCAYFTNPFEQTFCFTYYYGTTACKIEVDGVTCTSCESVGGAINPVQFDCENVGMGSGTRRWDDVIPPVIKEVCGDSYVTLYDYCFLCPNGLLPHPDAQLNVPGYDFGSCFELRAVASRGYFNETTCTYLDAAVQETCCGVLPEPFHCDICGMNDSYITEFNNTIEMNGTAMSCEDLLFASENGWISESECEFIPALVADTCGCTHLTDGGNVTGGDNVTSSPSTTTLEESELPTMAPGTVAPTDSASMPKTSLSSLPFVIPLAVGIFMMFCFN